MKCQVIRCGGAYELSSDSHNLPPSQAGFVHLANVVSRFDLRASAGDRERVVVHKKPESGPNASCLGCGLGSWTVPTYKPELSATFYADAQM